MFKTFGITNFKVFAERQHFELAPITLIYGPNSGGKSSIIQALLLLKQSVDATINQGLNDRVLIPKGLHVDLGQSKSIHHKHQFSNEISLEVGFKVSEVLAKRFPSPVFSQEDSVSTALHFEHKETLRTKLPVLTRVNYGAFSGGVQTLNVDLRATKKVKKADSDELDLEDAIETRRKSAHFVFSHLSSISSFNDFLKNTPKVRASEMQKDFFGIADMSSEESKNSIHVELRPTLTGKTNFLPSHVRRYPESATLEVPSRTLFQIARIFNLQFETMSYLGPLRSRPKRFYELSQQYQGSVGSSGEHSIEALKSDASDAQDEGEIVGFVNHWLSLFEIPYKIEVSEIGDEVLGDLAMLKLKDDRTGISVAATDVGFGIGQLLPIIIEGALAARANKFGGRSKTICIEQPEIHLHPKLQANIANFFVTTAQENGCQWIIETHSEALMLRLQKHMREGKLTPDEISVVFVEPAGDSGSRIMNLRLGAMGNFLDEWPGGFFEESFSEMFL